MFAEMRRFAPLLIAATWLAACEHSEGPAEKVTRTEVVPSTPPAPPDATPKPPEPVVVVPPDAAPAGPDAALGKDESGLELLSTGAEPRFALRYQPTQGAKQRMAMTMSMTMTVPPEPPIIFPEITVKAEISAVDVASNGDMKLALELTGLSAKDGNGNPIPDDQLKASMGDISGMKTEIQVDSRGHMATAGADMQAMAQQQMGFDQLVAAMPEAPVGKGAHWRIKQKIQQGALLLDQTLDVQVVEVTATTAKLKTKGKLSAPPQQIDFQGTPVDLARSTGKSEATVSIDFTRLVPTVRGSVELTMNLSSGGEKATMTNKSKMSMKAVK